MAVAYHPVYPRPGDGQHNVQQENSLATLTLLIDVYKNAEQEQVTLKTVRTLLWRKQKQQEEIWLIAFA